MDEELLLPHVLFPAVDPASVTLLHALATRRVYGYGEQIVGPMREEGGIFVVRCGRVRLELVTDAGWRITVDFRAAGEGFELHRIESPVAGTLAAVSAATTTIVESLPWAALVVYTDPQKVAELERRLQYAWGFQRALIRDVAYAVRRKSRAPIQT